MATKRKQRQPSEDLAATVADIISSPITKISLGFLQLGNPGKPEVLVEEERSSRPMGVDKSPVGIGISTSAVDVKPMGLESATMGVGTPIPLVPSLTVAVPTEIGSGTSGRNAEPVLRVMAAPGQVEAVPERDTRPAESRPMGLAKDPMGAELSPLGPDISPMGDSFSLGESPSTQSMFVAEQLGTLFPSSRVKRIRLAQEALSHVEEKVYDLLWGVKNQNRDAHRLASFSLQRIANEGRLNIKTVRELLPRLIEKGFIAIEREADVRRNRPTQYRVFSYSEVLADQRRRKRFWVIRTGKGVFYAHAVSVGVQRNDLAVEPEPMGLENEPMGVSGLTRPGSTFGRDLESKPMGLDIKPGGFEPSSTLLIGISKLVREGLNVPSDDSLLREMVIECRLKAQSATGVPATDEEILHFATAKTRVLRNATNLRNPLAVLRKAVCECFVGQPFVQYRIDEQARREREVQEAREYQAYLHAEELAEREFQQRQQIRAHVSARHQTQQGYDLKAIAEDPELDEQGREVAMERMRRLGRFASHGL